MDSRTLQHDTILTDDVVAELLAKEANEASIKYSSMGLEAFKTSKPLNKAKPNTRFLGRIIKETTSHNAALLAKESAEAQARLDNLTEAEERKRRKFNPSNVDIRRRQLGDISSILEGRKRGSRAKQEDDQDKDLSRHRASDKDSAQRKREGRQEEREEHRSSRGRNGKTTGEHRDRRRRRSHSPRHTERTHRHRSPLSSSEDDDRPRRSKPRSGKRSKDQDLIGNGSSSHKSHGRLRMDDEAFASPAKSTRSATMDDSDPLEELIGPAPPKKYSVRPRGRGVARGAAAMDSRFAEDYDPASDTQPEPAETAGDWDEAVEAFRDRQKWKQQGAERLRAAGFTDEQIRQWEKGGEKDIDDVRWTKAGEKREWDRGKEDSGH